MLSAAYVQAQHDQKPTNQILFKKNNKLCKKVVKKFGERKMFDVPLHRDLKKDRARKRHVRSANEMRSFFEGCLMLNV